MTRRVYLPGLAVVGVLTAGAMTGCANANDFTSATMDTDVARTYANYLRIQQATEGHPLRHSPVVQAACGRGGQFAGSNGAGKDWQCRMTTRQNGRPATRRYVVVARANACYTATNPNFGAQLIRTANGKRVPDPLYQFDGCVAG